MRSGPKRTWETVVTSLALMSVVVVACLAVGLPVAWLLARSGIRFRGVWLVLVALPLAIPSYVAAYAWLALLCHAHVLAVPPLCFVLCKESC